MKKVFFVALFFSGMLLSCKKDKDVPVCPTTVAGIAANYKATKVELLNGSNSTDVSGNYLTDNCIKNALYQLKADKTIIYTEIESSCTGSAAGVWDVVNNKITITNAWFEFADDPIAGWDCSTPLIDDTQGSVTLRYTFTKQ